MAEPVETKMRWGQLGIGHVLLRDGRKWTVVDARAPEQYDYGQTPWLLIRAPRGEEHAIAPKSKRFACTVLIDPEADPIPPAYASDGDRAAALLEETLGATEIAWRDQETGEVWCPIEHWGDDQSDAEAKDLQHLRLAHGMDPSGIETLGDFLKIHVRAHTLGDPLSKGGFTHRHVPEDLSIM